jgi:hypothetical protein
MMTATVVAEVAAAATATATAMAAMEAAVCCGRGGGMDRCGAAAAAHLNRCKWYEGMKTRGQKFCLWTYYYGVQYYKMVYKNAACGQALRFLPDALRLATPRTTGYLLNLSTRSIFSTFLQALCNLMDGVEIWSVLGLRATSHSSISSTATWMRHVLGPHVSCDKC